MIPKPRARNQWMPPMDEDGRVIARLRVSTSAPTDDERKRYQRALAELEAIGREAQESHHDA